MAKNNDKKKNNTGIKLAVKKDSEDTTPISNAPTTPPIAHKDCEIPKIKPC